MIVSGQTMSRDLWKSMTELFKAGESSVGGLSGGGVSTGLGVKLSSSIYGPSMGEVEISQRFIGQVHEFLPGGCGCVILKGMKDGEEEGIDAQPSYEELPPVLNCTWCDAVPSIIFRANFEEGCRHYYSLHVYCGRCRQELSNRGVSASWSSMEPKGRTKEWVSVIQRWNELTISHQLFCREMTDPQLWSIFGNPR